MRLLTLVGPPNIPYLFLARHSESPRLPCITNPSGALYKPRTCTRYNPSQPTQTQEPTCLLRTLYRDLTVSDECLPKCMDRACAAGPTEGGGRGHQGAHIGELTTNGTCMKGTGRAPNTCNRSQREGVASIWAKIVFLTRSCRWAKKATRYLLFLVIYHAAGSCTLCRSLRDAGCYGGWPDRMRQSSQLQRPRRLHLHERRLCLRLRQKVSTGSVAWDMRSRKIRYQ